MKVLGLKQRTAEIWIVLIVMTFLSFSVGFSLGNSQRGAEVIPNLVSEENIHQESHDSAALININTATAGELISLPGIGEKLADAIISYRTEHGAFRNPYDLIHVKGIGERKLSAILDLITT